MPYFGKDGFACDFGRPRTRRHGPTVPASRFGISLYYRPFRFYVSVDERFIFKLGRNA